MSDHDISDIVGAEPRRAVVPTEDVFRPWHRPRKQFIRSEQWSRLLRELLGALADRGHSREVRYLGLPGEDLLDIRVFHDTIAEMGDGWRLRFLGFGGSGTAKQVLSEAVTHDLPRLNSEGSHYYQYPLESVVAGNGPGGRALREFANLDVVNIDLCDAVRPPGGSGILDALRAIVCHQLRTRAYPWLLLLTTRIDPPSMDPDAHGSFLRCVAHNVELHRRFADLLQTEMELDAAALRRLIDQVTRHGPSSGDSIGRSHLPATALGIGKWLLGLLTRERCTLTLRSSYQYSIRGSVPDMVSLAFRLERHPPVVQDPLGLTRETSRRASPDEAEVACQLIRPLSRMVDVDAKLASDRVLRAKLVDTSASLLGRAGHDGEAYRAWVAQYRS